MNRLRVSSAYTNQINSVYSANKVSVITNEPETSSDGKQLNVTSSPNEINDTVVISLEAQELYIKDKLQKQEEAKNKNQSYNSPSQKDLTSDEKKTVEKLQTVDAEIKAHEKAHIAAASGISASSPTYQYKTGPDGNKYAVAGEVHVSFTPEGNPVSDKAKAETMEASALAPAQHSSQDMAVAKKAEAMIAQEKQKLAEQQLNSLYTSSKSTD